MSEFSANVTPVRTPLQLTLHDSRLTNEQRLVISEYMYSPTPIVDAFIRPSINGVSLFIWIKGESHAYRVSPEGKVVVTQ